MVKLVKRVVRSTAPRVLFLRNRRLALYEGVQVYRLRATGKELSRWDVVFENRPGTPHVIEGRRYVVHSTEDGGETVLLDPAPTMARRSRPAGAGGAR